MAEIIQAVRGMNDILPQESFVWQHAERIMRRVLLSYGYQEIRTPMVEKTELFKRSIGEVTDIVEKEMYSFLDRNQENLTLRPEGTACCVRAGMEHGLFYNQIQRLWYTGPFFRHERPQKGRYRQFHQCSAEVFGLTGPDIDAELIMLSATILEKLGLKSLTTLQLNSLGTAESRSEYRKRLVHYLNEHKDQLDEDSVRRLHKNPLRVLDSKNPDLKHLIANAPKLLDHLDQASLQHFETLQQYLTQAGIAFEINPCLVRGLDYYSKTVFEWVTDKLGAQGTVCAGGRYDTLVEQLGGKPTSAIGFSLGMERIILLMQQSEHNHKIDSGLHAYFITDSEASFPAALKMANYLRSKVLGLRLMLHCGGGSLKSQFKKADKSGAQYAIIMGEHEIKTRSVSLKNLREDTPQQALYQDELAEYLKLKIAKK
ncbi:MAG: histidine--tRNA ligase [Gammaproteobacteria bacterium]|nr:MAG: histidine--tRNA ligase [Gammaproteobacteria bacterium]